MNFKINYGNAAGVIPTWCEEYVKRASLCDMKVLWLVCAKGSLTLSELAELAGASEKEVKSSLAYWTSSGVIAQDGTDKKTEAKAPAEKKPTEEKRPSDEKKVTPTDELPKYTSDQLAEILESNTSLGELIDECQRIMGKMLNYHEVNIIIGFVDYLNLDFEYILLLLNYCVNHGKKTLHYVESTAFGLYNEGITTPEELSVELQRRENVHSLEGKIRNLFGVGSRSFTSKEKKEISAWINDWGFELDMIQKAYEVTADTTGKASLHYAHSVLERWNAEGLRTVEAVDAAQLQYSAELESKKKSKKTPKNNEGENSSFKTDEFFEAAIKRSLGGGEE